MIPSAFVYLDRFPITPNGKVDRRALPAPDRNRSQPAEGFVAPRDELELQLTQIWGKVLGVEHIGMEDNFFDLGGHSLLAVRLFDRIQKKIGKHLTLATLFQAPTIAQLARILRQEESTTAWSSLVPIQDGGSKPPFFCLHGCFGEVAHFYDLARLLGPEQPFYGLRALGLEEGQVPQTRFEDMAAHYIKEIRTIQSDGPYFIGASGAGCIIALEIAHQLESQGQHVTLLALMIPSNLKPTNLKPNSSPKTFSKFFRKYIRLSKLYFSLLIIVARSRLVLPTIKHFFLNRVLWHLKFCRRFIPGEIHRLHRFEDAFTKALQSYEPEAYQGRITCFLNDEYSHNHKRRHNKKRRIDDWYDLAVGGLDVRVVPGDTFTMWREPHVQILAEQLKASLDDTLTDIDVQRKQATPTHAADAETGQDALAAPRVSNQ
jgi:aspartate racemase